MNAVDHERELREAWQKSHLDKHADLARALVEAREQIDQKLEGMNELRMQITSERGLYVTREMFDREHASLRETMDTRLKFLEGSANNLQGRLWAIGAAISFIVALTTIAINLFLKK